MLKPNGVPILIRRTHEERILGVLGRTRSDDFVGCVHRGNVDAAVAEVDAEKLPGCRVERQSGRRPAAPTTRLVRIRFDDCAACEQASGDLGDCRS
jgi:hypothetical protein